MRPSCSSLTRVASASSRPTTSLQPQKPEFNRTYENGKVHVTSINAGTGEHSVLKLTPASNFTSTKALRYFPLPAEAVEGLKRAVVNCSRPAKQLQNEADHVCFCNY